MYRSRAKHLPGLPTLQIASLFSGAGGLDFGFVQGGATVRFATEIDPTARATYEHNLRHTPASTRVEELSGKNLKGVDLVLAGPPCQGFSSIGRRDITDPRNSLILAAAAIIADASPGAFVLENVAGLVWLANGRFLRRALAILHQAGLEAEPLTVYCSLLGVPQRRRRVLLVGGKGSLGKRFLAATRASLARPPRQIVTVSDVLLPPVPFGNLPNHEAPPKHSAWYDQVISRLGPGQKLCDTRMGASAVHSWDIPEVFGTTSNHERSLLNTLARLRRSERDRRYLKIGDGRPVPIPDLARALDWSPRFVTRLVSSIVAKGFARLSEDPVEVDLTHKFNGRFKRLALDSPAPAVVREFAHPRNVLHPTQPRGLTVRECARLQTFPDNFVFLGSRSSQYSQVANAFPPRVSYHLLASALSNAAS